MALFSQCNVKRCLRYSTEVTCFLLVLLPLIIFYLAVEPRRRGFFCNDETLMYPYVTSTVTDATLVSVGICMLIFGVIVIELISLKSRNSVDIVNLKKYSLSQQYLITCCMKIVPFLFGASICQLITDVGKYSSGRLRPHFFSVCKPDFSRINCSHGYITNYHCTGQNEKLIKQARLSFPSGHASFSFYCCVSLMIYIHTALPRQRFHLLRPVFQVALLLIAYFTAMTRVADYYHHYTDVAVGTIIGIVVAIFTIALIIPRFDHKPTMNNTCPLEKVNSTKCVQTSPIKPKLDAVTQM